MHDHAEMIELVSEGDSDIVAESEAALENPAAQAERMEVETLLSGEADSNDVYLEFTPGQAGQKARIGRPCCAYDMRWAEKKGYQTNLIDRTDEEAGIKSATLEIKGFNAYGWSTELVKSPVRISPLTAMRAAIPALQVSVIR